MTRALMIPLLVAGLWPPALALGEEVDLPVYRVEFLGDAHTTRGMNALGDCVGSTFPPYESTYAWVSLDGQPAQVLPLPDGLTSGEAFDINDFRQIVGYAQSGPDSQAVLWTPNGSGGFEVKTLGALPGFPQSRALAINNVGDIVGKAAASSGAARPVLFTPEGNVDLAIVYGYGTSLIEDVTNRREVLGMFYRLDLDTGIVEAGPWPALRAGNEVGQLAGVINALPQNTRAVRWTEGVGVEDITIYPTPYCSSKSINDFGDVVFEPDAVHLDGIGSFNLNELISPDDADWIFTSNWHDMGINNSGQIVTIASNSTLGLFGAVRLTPINRPLDAFIHLGGGTAGVAGQTALILSGPLTPGSTLALDLFDAAGSAPALVFLSTASTPAPFLGGTLHALPIGALVVSATDAMGEIHASGTFPGAPVGAELYLQVAVADPSVPVYGASLSNAMRGTVP